MTMQLDECFGSGASFLCTLPSPGMYIRQPLRHRGGAKRRAGAPYPGRCGSSDPLGPTVRSGREGGSPDRTIAYLI
jgi:hypothetical protein